MLASDLLGRMSHLAARCSVIEASC